MHDLWANPMVNSVAVLLVIGLGGVLVKMLTLWSARLSHLIDLAAEQAHRAELLVLTTTKTETLVNSQRQELRAEVDALKARLDTAQLAKDLATEAASKLALKMVEDFNAHATIQAALRRELEQALQTIHLQAQIGRAATQPPPPNHPGQADPRPPSPVPPPAVPPPAPTLPC